MRYYDYLSPSVNFMGPGCVKELGHRCELLNMKKPLIVTDSFLVSVEEYNLISNPEKLRDIAVFMGKNVEGLSLMEAAHAAVDAMRELAEDVGIPSGLAQMGVKEEDFELMAENALRDGNAFSNPRKGTKEDIISLFRKAM